MTLARSVRHAFIDLVPADREDGVVYISMKYSTAVHNCLCGCGMKVVTPMRPDKWILTYDGETISLSPSIGNWSFHCRSHYWIRRSQVVEAGPMSQGEIDYGRRRDADLTSQHFGKTSASTPAQVAPPTSVFPPHKKRGFWAKLFGG